MGRAEIGVVQQRREAGAFYARVLADPPRIVLSQLGEDATLYERCKREDQVKN